MNYVQEFDTVFVVGNEEGTFPTGLVSIELSNMLHLDG